MTKFNLYVGLNDKTTKRQEISTIEAYKLITNKINAMQLTTTFPVIVAANK